MINASITLADILERPSTAGASLHKRAHMRVRADIAKLDDNPTEKTNPDVEELKDNQKPKSQLEKALDVISLQDQSAVNDIINAQEIKVIKVEEKKKSKMKKWPDNTSELLPYNDIVNPVKEILRRGYRLWRKDEIKGFDYEGYNIGKHELQNHPSPRERLSEKSLQEEKKLGHTVMDVVLNIMFLLGVEQGRRAEKRDAKPMEDFLETLEAYRQKNKDQRIRIDELEVMLELKTSQPNLSDDDFMIAVRDGVDARRKMRIEEVKSELKLDPSKSSFQFKTPQRAKFKELEKLANTLTKETCSSDQWKQILQEKGWSFNEWVKRCSKKKVVNAFL